MYCQTKHILYWSCSYSIHTQDYILLCTELICLIDLTSLYLISYIMALAFFGTEINKNMSLLVVHTSFCLDKILKTALCRLLQRNPLYRNRLHRNLSAICYQLYGDHWAILIPIEQAVTLCWRHHMRCLIWLSEWAISMQGYLFVVFIIWMLCVLVSLWVSVSACQIHYKPHERGMADMIL